MIGAATAGDTERGARIRTLVLCILAQNLINGLTFGSFGPLLAANEAHFGISRGMVAVGMSVLTLTVGVVSLFAGKMLSRVPVRAAMMVGMACAALGHCGLAFTHNYNVALAMYMLIGAGVSLVGVLGPLTLAMRWFSTNRGKILGLINLPAVMLVSPYIVAMLLPEMGRFNLLLAIAGLLALMVPLLSLLAERPASLPVATDTASAAPVAVAVSPLRSIPFWLLGIGIGIWSGMNTTFLVHIVPAGVGRGMPAETAAGMISAFAAAGVGGALVFGWIADRIGAFAALTLSATIQALCWMLILGGSPALMFAVAAVIGLCASPQTVLHGAALGELFDAEVVSRAMGLSYVMKLPFMLGFAPLIGVLFDRSGGYAMPFTLCVVSLVVAAALFLAALLYIRGAKRAAALVLPDSNSL